MPGNNTVKINNEKYLWNMVSFDKNLNSNLSLPFENTCMYKLLPVGGVRLNNINYYDILKNFKSPQTNVNVLLDYNWTTSPAEARKKSPKIILKEKQIWKNNTLAKLYYNIKSSIGFADRYSSVIDSVVNGTTQLLSNITNKTVDTLNNMRSAVQQKIVQYDPTETPEINRLAGLILEQETALTNATNDISIGQVDVSEAASTAANALLSIVRNYSGTASDILSMLELSSEIANLNGPLKAYDGLYFCLNSGFQYILPYFENDVRSVNNDFRAGAEGTTQMITELFETATSGIANTLGGVALLDPNAKGFYIEQAKPFQYPSSGESFTVSFPLNNTGTWQEVCNNWYFVYLLLYQNQPAREDRLMIAPPAIYEVEIPCVRYIPYAFIKNLSISYIGVRRYMKINIIRNNKLESINTIIPEAWQIKMTIEGLTSEPSNFNFLQNKIVTTNNPSVGGTNA